MRTDLKGEITVSAFLSFCLCDLLLSLNAGVFEAEFLDEIQTKVSTEFSSLLFTVTLQLCLKISISLNSRNLLLFLLQLLYTVKHKGGKPDRKSYPLLVV